MHDIADTSEVVELPSFVRERLSREEYYTRFLTECDSNHPLVGTKIWRRVQRPHGCTVLWDVRFLPREDDQPTLFRAYEHVSKDRKKRLHVAPNLTHRGVMCYCFEPIDDKLWTYFIVWAVHPTENIWVVTPVNSMEDLVNEYAGDEKR